MNLRGSEFLVERFSSSGTVLDISRQSPLAEVDRLLAVGTGSALSLVRDDDFVRPAAPPEAGPFLIPSRGSGG